MQELHEHFQQSISKLSALPGSWDGDEKKKNRHIIASESALSAGIADSTARGVVALFGCVLGVT